MTDLAGSGVVIGLLDEFSIEVRGADAAGPELSPGVQRLLAHVCLHGRVGRGATAGLLWPELSEVNANSSLRSTLWRLQKTWPGLVQPVGTALRLSAGVEVDVHDLMAWARAVLRPDPDPPSGLPDVALRGELLPGWYDDWVLMEREQLRQLRMHALEVLADALASVHRFGEAMQAALAAVRAEPLRESAHRSVIRVHLAEGNVVEAVRTYDAFRALVDDELGVAPSPHMTELVRGLRRPERRGAAVRTGRPARASRPRPAETLGSDVAAPPPSTAPTLG